MDDEDVGAVAQSVEGRVALRAVVVVVAGGGARHVDDRDVGEHTQAAYEIDGTRRARRGWPKSCRTTASAAGSLGPTARSGWPSIPNAASTSREASMRRAQLAARPARWDRPLALSDRSCGGVQSASTQSAGATMMWRYSTPAWKRHLAAELLVQGLDDRRGVVAGRMAAGEVDHRAVAADGDEVAAIRDLVGAELEAQRRGLDRCPTGVEAAPGRSRRSTCCRHRCPAAGPAGSPRPDRHGLGRRASATSASTRPRAACGLRVSRAVRRRTRRARTPRTSLAARLPARRVAHVGLHDLGSRWAA